MTIACRFLDLFKRHDLKGLDHAIHLLISQNVSKGDTEIQFEKSLVQHFPTRRHRELAALEPNCEGGHQPAGRDRQRRKTGPTRLLSLLGQTQRAGFVDRVRQTLGFQTPSQKTH